MSTRLNANPNFLVRGDSSGPSHRRQWHEVPREPTEGSQLWCYTDRRSYARGESIAVHAISNVGVCSLQITHESLQGDIAYQATDIPVHWADTPLDCSSALRRMS